MKNIVAILEGDNCAGCEFVVDHDSTLGDYPRTPDLRCHRFPPTAIPVSTAVEHGYGAASIVRVAPYYPPVSREHWCGEFKGPVVSAWA